jgi:hypothetical protein
MFGPAPRLRTRLGALGAAALMATSLATTSAPTAPARAAGGAPRAADGVARLQGGDPAARIQVVIKSVTVSNDRDGFWTGAGDILLKTSIWRCTGPRGRCSASEDNPARLLAYAPKAFDANSGEMEVLNRLVPLAGDVKDGAVASEELGIALQAGQEYLLQFNAFERDAGGGDFMGGIQRAIHEGNGWGVGSYTLEPAGHLPDGSLPPTPDDILCAGCGGIVVGDYLVTYEIRRTPLPDLRPTGITVTDRDDASDVCVAVENRGQQDAAQFGLAVYVDNSMPPNGNIQSEGLALGASRDVCVRVNLPTSGRHRLRAIVDQSRFVPEMDETNNALDRGLDRTPLGSTLPQIEPVVAEADSSDNPPPTPTTQGDDAPSRTPRPPLSEAGDLAEEADTGGTSTTGAPLRPAGGRPPVVPKPTLTEIPPADLSVGDVKIEARDGGRCVIRGSRNSVFVTVVNGGGRNSGQVRVEVRAGGQERGDRTIDGVGAGAERVVQIGDVGIAEGERSITVVLDPDNKVSEGNEANNSKTVEIDCVRR